MMGKLANAPSGPPNAAKRTIARTSIGQRLAVRRGRRTDAV
jgi:hypothetical protein